MGWLLVILNFMVLLVFFSELPEKVPVHFNFKGETDGFGDKSKIWGLPIMGALIYLLMHVIVTKLKPWYFNYPVKVTEKNAPKLYAMSIEMMVLLNFCIALMFLFISTQVIVPSVGFEGVSFGWFIVPLLALITFLPFWYIYRMFKIPKE